jgi:hypothetical protein
MVAKICLSPKLDQNGDWQWAKQFGTATGDERCYQVAPANGSVFLAGKAPSVAI